MPFESDMISAMPMMPMLPAKAVRTVRVFLVSRLLVDRASAVRKLIEVFSERETRCSRALSPVPES